jgi:hypothetical protein
MSSVEEIIDALIVDEEPPNGTSGRNSDKTALWIQSLCDPFADMFCVVSLCKMYRTRVQPFVHSILQGDSKDDDESVMFRLTCLNSFVSLVIERNVSPSSSSSVAYTSTATLQELFADVLLFPALEDAMKVSLHDSSPLLTNLRLFLLRWMQLTLTRHQLQPDPSLLSTLRSWTCRLLAATSVALSNDDNNDLPFFSSLDPMLYFDSSITETLAQPLSLDLLLSNIVRHLHPPNVANHSWSSIPYIPLWQQLHALVLQVTAEDDAVEVMPAEDNSLPFWQQKVLERLDNDDDSPMTKKMIQWVYPPPESPPSSVSSLHLGRLQSSHPPVVSPEVVMDDGIAAPEQQRWALLHFFLLSTVTPTTFETHWIPLIFAWLQSSRDAEIHTAILILDRWLHKSNDLTDVVWNNLCLIFQRLRKIHRHGWNLIWLGWLERRLFHYGFSRGILESKRILQSMQEWLLILDRNNRHYTQDHLIYGLLCVVTPFLYDCVHRYTSLDGGVDLGRLGLSSLLPILEGAAGYGELWQCHAGDEVIKDVPVSLSVMVHFLTLASLSNLLIFSYPVVSRHAGKILCSLLVFVRRLDDFGTRKGVEFTALSQLREPHRQCALHVAARALVLCGTAADVVLTRIVQGDQYDQGIVDIIGSIRVYALKISNRVE